MAPNKALWIQRIVSADWMGMNWMKVTHAGPFTMTYPYTLSSAPVTKMMSHPQFQGNRANRMGFNKLRSTALLGPTLIVGAAVVFYWDWYTPLYLLAEAGVETPENFVQMYKAEQEWKSRYQFGIQHKHTVGGQVSIPGSEVLAMPAE